jgi:hypothetical protein
MATDKCEITSPLDSSSNCIIVSFFFLRVARLRCFKLGYDKLTTDGVEAHMKKKYYKSHIRTYKTNQNSREAISDQKLVYNILKIKDLF